MLYGNVNKNGAFIEGLTCNAVNDFPIDIIRNASSNSAQALSLCMRFQHALSEHFPLILSAGRRSLKVQENHALHHSSSYFGGQSSSQATSESACFGMGLLLSSLMRLKIVTHCARVILLPADESLAYGRFLLGIPIMAHGGMPRVLLNSQCLLMSHRPKDSLDRHQAEIQFNDILTQYDDYKKDPVNNALDALRQNETIRDMSDLSIAMNIPAKILNQQLTGLGSSFFQVMEYHQRSRLVDALTAGNDDYQDVAGRLHLNSTRQLGATCRRLFHRTPESIRYRA